jgi:RNA polymerase sigma-70 factor (ECF subfamily)
LKRSALRTAGGSIGSVHKGWPAHAASNTVLRGEQPRNRLARWSRWFPTAPTVEEARFQGPDEPHPRHWRRFPRPWPPIDPGDPAVGETLSCAIEELPRRWRGIVIARDVRGRSAAQISDEEDMTPAQQRAVLNRARAMLRDRLARGVLGDAE